MLKVLYESLVDPDERHDLGEYYTPDWLAARIVMAAVEAPLTQRVLDPACGSGTFLFHALRRLIAAGRSAGWSGQRILRACADKVRGLDVHPVAVTLARVTWLLALGDLVADRPAKLTVPVFLGDAMQWNLRQYMGGADVVVDVPEDRPLHIPAGFAEDQAVFEQALDALNQGLADDATPEAVGHALRRIEGAASSDVNALVATFAQLQTLHRAGRNAIWTFVLRNLVRPVGLSRPEQRADVLLGNPPWIVYRHLSAAMKDRLREALRVYDLWVGGNLATQQDMCALFWARGADRYLGRGGRLAFVLPYAVLNAPVFAGLRSGRLGQTRVRITGGWSLERVWPIFGAQSGSSTTSTCVLFGRREMAGPPPAEVDRWEGRLPRRDADDIEATRALKHTRTPWPRPRTLVGASPYRTRFRQARPSFRAGSSSSSLSQSAVWAAAAMRHACAAGLDRWTSTLGPLWNRRVVRSRCSFCARSFSARRSRHTECWKRRRVLFRWTGRNCWMLLRRRRPGIAIWRPGCGIQRRSGGALQ